MAKLQDLLTAAHATSFDEVPDMDDLDIAKLDQMVPDPVNPTNLSASATKGAMPTERVPR